MKTWKHSVRIKHLFKPNTTPELIVKLCSELISQLNPILNIYETSDEDGADSIFYKLESIITELESLRDDALENFNLEDEFYNQELEDQFNYIMVDLYDLGDSNKLIWIT